MNFQNSLGMRLKACSSVYGKISMIMLAYRGTAKSVSKEMITARFGKIFEAFGDRVTFVILANGVTFQDQKQEAEIVSAFERALEESHLFPKHHVICVGTYPGHSYQSQVIFDAIDTLDDHTQWTQDAFIVLTGENGEVVLLEPMLHANQSNAFMAEQLASSANILLKPTRYQLEGGNVLVGDDFALIGKDTLESNRKHFFSHLKLEAGQAEVTSEFKRLLGVKYIVWVGFENQRNFQLKFKQGTHNLQPLFHLDLFVTLGGKDPKTGNELVFVAKPDLVRIHCQEDKKNELAGKMRDFAGALDEIAKQIEGNYLSQPSPQFIVERMPMAISVDSTERPTIYSYNNGHVEWFHGIKRIYLPYYETFSSGKHNVESEVSRLLTSLGFRKTFIEKPFDSYAKYENGALHCMTKVLARTAY